MKTLILSMAAMAALLLIEYIIISVIVCRKMTGTWNALHFIFSHKYWCIAVLNYRYYVSRKEGKSTEEFIISFTDKYLLPCRRNVIQRLRECERKLLIHFLSNQAFIIREFGKMPFTLVRYQDIEKSWEQEIRRIEDGKRERCS